MAVGALGERASAAVQRRAAVCLPFILTRGLLWFLPEQSRTNGRDTRVPEALQCKQFELANTPMKSELYVGLDVAQAIDSRPTSAMRVNWPGSCALVN